MRHCKRKWGCATAEALTAYYYSFSSQEVDEVSRKEFSIPLHTFRAEVPETKDHGPWGNFYIVHRVPTYSTCITQTILHFMCIGGKSNSLRGRGVTAIKLWCVCRLSLTMTVYSGQLTLTSAGWQATLTFISDS